jgi:hypothetical protein
MHHFLNGFDHETLTFKAFLEMSLLFRKSLVKYHNKSGSGVYLIRLFKVERRIDSDAESFCTDSLLLRGGQ